MTPAAVIGRSLLRALAAIQQEFVLVLDDYHVIHARAIHEIMAELTRHPLPALRLVFAARNDPPLPLASLRARGHVVELRAADLRFSLAETAAFLRDEMRLQVDNQTVSDLKIYTEGWVAGLAGPAGDSRTYLEWLERNNLFLLSIDGEGRWFRYHHLFRMLLVDQLERQHGRAEMNVLHSRASAWFVQNGYAEDALQHALAAGDTTTAVQVFWVHSKSVEPVSEVPGTSESAGDFIRQDFPPLVCSRVAFKVQSGHSRPMRRQSSWRDSPMTLPMPSLYCLSPGHAAPVRSTPCAFGVRLLRG